jgi:hypothetical protein
MKKGGTKHFCTRAIYATKPYKTIKPANSKLAKPISQAS